MIDSPPQVDSIWKIPKPYSARETPEKAKTGSLGNAVKTSNAGPLRSPISWMCFCFIGAFLDMGLGFRVKGLGVGFMIMLDKAPTIELWAKVEEPNSYSEPRS